MVIIPLCLIAIKCSVSRLKPIAYQQIDRFTSSPFSGVELGFKFATRTVIYILNPCHITTIMQIYLLACNKSTKSSTVLFRLQMNYLNGPLLAFMFPETDSRQLPLESSIYWIQHALMCIIPIFLLKSGGVYNMEPLNDFTWNVIGYATLILYHFGILQVIASVSLLTSNYFGFVDFIFF
uniref:Transmembrane protein 164 n=1 Tax=Anopheles merus TaxID=30066 RepID=A0A182V3R1_ANOME